ncbi:MAG: N-acetyl-gamma-glutamyl-phosphate reductase [Anaerovoracaceae bacterium]
MKYRVFIDGAEGTTGLKIHQYFQKRDDIEVLGIEQEKRKDMEERLSMIKKADVSFLCLPDAAAREIAAAAPEDCRILDTSTAHRTDDSWVYGMPELSGEQRRLIKESNRVAVPGCHATGVILLIKPLLEAGLLPRDHHFCAFSLTGYSGGGKKMIAQYEGPERQRGNMGQQDMLCSPRQYGLTQTHKHLPEIMAAAGISSAPAFIPVVADYYSGMEVTIPVRAQGLEKQTVEHVIGEYYAGQPLVRVKDSVDDGGFIAAGRLSGTNELEIAIEGNDENILLIATYDNLGKGASGAAVQNMNLMLGIEETKGLI